MDLASSFTPALVGVLRSLTPWRKLELARDLNRMADVLALAGLRLRQPTVSDAMLAYSVAIQRLGPGQRQHGIACLEGMYLMATPIDPLVLAVRVGSLLDHLGITYVIGGSVAAVVHGEYRMTRALDIILSLTSRDRQALAAGLREDFTFLPSDITDAFNRIPEAREDWRKRASFCAYDKATGFQLDIYLSSGRPFERMQFLRAVTVPIPGEGGGFLRIASAEDTILAKLEWYKLSPSDRHWRDIQAILYVQGDALALAYLHTWAESLGITDLLTLALQGQPPSTPADQPQQQRMF